MFRDVSPKGDMFLKRVWCSGSTAASKTVSMGSIPITLDLFNN